MVFFASHWFLQRGAGRMGNGDFFLTFDVWSVQFVHAECTFQETLESADNPTLTVSKLIYTAYRLVNTVNELPVICICL